MANKFPLILNTSANQIQEIASGDNLDLTGCKIVGLQGINSAGIVTFTKAHVGAATTWGEDLVVTGNARVTGILTVGTNSVTINGNDVNITGVTTSANFKTGTSNLHNVGLEIAGINVLGADTPIGTGATIYNSGAAVFTGIVTATNYVGTINTPAQPNITSLGTLSALNVSGNVSIGGTLTYEDVTNIDAVGLITARNGINVSGGTATFAGAIDANGSLDVDGHTELDNVSIAGVTTASSNVYIQKSGDAAFSLGSTNAGGATIVLDGDSNGDWTGNDYSSIRHDTSGNLVLKANSPGAAHCYIQLGSGGHYGAMFKEGAESLLRYNNSTKIATTDTGAQFTGTDFGFGATPGGTPASKNVFLAIGDSDTGIVQDGDGQLELWANAVEVANINAIDGYTSTKPITTTNNISGNGATFTNDLTAKSALFTDNGTASPIVDIRSDDGSPWQLQIANDSYSTGAYGLNFHVDNSGTAYIRHQTGASSAYKPLNIGLNNGSTTLECLTLTSTSTTSLNRITAPSITLNDNGTSGVLLNVRTDDASPFAVCVGNDSYNTGSFGMHEFQDNSGNYFMRLINNSEYKNLYIQTGNNTTNSTGIYIDANRSVGLNYAGETRFWTRSNGGTVQGNATAVSLDFNSNSTYRGSLYADNNNNIGILDHTGNWVFLTNRGAANSILYDSHFRSDTNGLYDLGTSSYRWRNIYTSDLDLSNETRKDEGGNEVDGTWGAYTIQEGEDDLFLINRRSGKKYKFNLTEVS